MTKEYHVEFAIEVSADSPAKACQRAWELLTQTDSFQPIGTVLDLDTGDREDIDLQELAEEEKSK